MKDYLVKGLAYNGQVRIIAARTVDTVGEAQHRHYTWPTASAALGRSMTFGVMLGSMLNNEDKLTIRINGGGDLGTILVDANANGKVRGYVTNPQTHFPLNSIGKLDVRRAVGTDGMVTISKDIGLQQPFVGQVPIISGELGEDFTYYLAQSEQIPSSVGVGVIVNPDNTIQAAGGFIIQALPGTAVEIIEEIEKRLDSIPTISAMVRDGLTPEEILTMVVGEGNVKILETQEVLFQCTCSKDRSTKVLVSLGSEELQDMIETDGQAETQCHFCNETYQFNKSELEAMLEQAV